MSHQFEDYREISNVRDKLDFIIELVRSAPRRVFLTERGEVKAVVLGPKDYEDLWNLDIDREMKLCDEEPELITQRRVHEARWTNTSPCFGRRREAPLEQTALCASFSERSTTCSRPGHRRRSTGGTTCSG